MRRKLSTNRDSSQLELGLPKAKSPHGGKRAGAGRPKLANRSDSCSEP